MCARQYHMQKHPILSPWNFPRSHLVWGLKDTNNSSQYENLKRFQGNKKVYLFQKKLLIRFGNRIEHYLAPNLLVEIHLANFFSMTSAKWPWSSFMLFENKYWLLKEVQAQGWIFPIALIAYIYTTKHKPPRKQGLYSTFKLHIWFFIFTK